MSRIDGPAILGLADVFVGVPAPKRPTTVVVIPKAQASPGQKSAGPHQATAAAARRLTLPKGGAGKKSPHVASVERSAQAGDRALAKAMQAQAQVKKYEAAAKSGKHGPVVPLKVTAVRKDGKVVLGAAKATQKAMTPTQKAAVVAHTQSVAKNARITQRLAQAAAVAQRAGAEAKKFAAAAVPFYKKRLAGPRPGITRLAGLLDLEPIGEGQILLGEAEDPGMDPGGPVPGGPVPRADPGAMDSGATDPGAAEPTDAGAGAVTAPDGTVLYDPATDPEILPRPLRGQPLSRDEALAVFDYVPDDGIVYQGQKGYPSGSLTSLVKAYDPSPTRSGYYWHGEQQAWFRRQGHGGGVEQAVSQPGPGDKYEDFDTRGQPWDDWPNTQMRSMEKGFGPLVGTQPGGSGTDGPLAGLQLAQKGTKDGPNAGKPTWFWQSHVAPVWATQEVDRKIAEANQKIIQANRAAAVVEALRLAKEKAEQEEAQRKQDAANALAMSAADTQAAIAEKAKAAQQGQLDIQAQKAELEMTKQEAGLAVQERTAELQRAQEQARLEAAAQNVLIREAELRNEAIARGELPPPDAYYADDEEPYDADSPHMVSEEGYGGAYEGGAYDFGAEDDGFGDGPSEDD